MKPPRRVRVKVCCISSVEEGRLAVRFGADALGLVPAKPSGPGVIPEPLIAEIASTVPPGVGSVALTSLQSASAIIDQQRRLRVNTLQLCERVPDGTHQQLRAGLPGVALVQVIRVVGEESAAEAVAVAPFVDGILLDSGAQDLEVRELCGSGGAHDWQVCRKIRDAVSVPLFLAGGLHAGNVAEAIAAVDPFGIDACGGVRTHGRLDEAKLATFFHALDEALR